METPKIRLPQLGILSHPIRQVLTFWEFIMSRLKYVVALALVVTFANMSSAQTVIQYDPSGSTVIYTGPSTLVYPNNPTLSYVRPPMVETSMPYRYSRNSIYQQPNVYSQFPIYQSGPSIGVGNLYGRTYYNNSGFYRIDNNYNGGYYPR
jgi:hypothetical protein